MPSVSIGIGVTIPIVIIIVVIVVLICVLTSRRRRLARNRIPLVNNAASTSVVVTGSTATAYPMQQSMDQKLGPLPPAPYLSGGEAPPAYPH